VKLSAILRPSNVILLPGGPLSASVLNLFDAADLGTAVGDPVAVRARLEHIAAENLVAHADRGFLVHLRHDALSDVILLAGRASEPVHRELGDGETQAGRLLMILLAPSRRAAEHLQLAGAIGRLVSRQDFADAVAANEDIVELAQYLTSLDLDLPPQLRVRDIMSGRPHTTTPDATLREAAREMVRSGLGGLIAVDQDSRVVGLLGERELMRDLLNNYLQGGTANRDAPASTGRRRVRDVMTRQVLGVSPDQPLSEVASIMVNKDVERVPVVEEGRLIGVLTRADIVRKIIGS
jgi:CBS domain-containing protein